MCLCVSAKKKTKAANVRSVFEPIGNLIEMRSEYFWIGTMGGWAVCMPRKHTVLTFLVQIYWLFFLFVAVNPIQTRMCYNRTLLEKMCVCVCVRNKITKKKKMREWQKTKHFASQSKLRDEYRISQINVWHTFSIISKIFGIRIGFGDDVNINGTAEKELTALHSTPLCTAPHHTVQTSWEAKEKKTEIPKHIYSNAKRLWTKAAMCSSFNSH